MSFNLKNLGNQAVFQLSSLWRKTLPSVKTKDVFTPDLILHFSYHKCLTAYYRKIAKSLANEFGFFTEHFKENYVPFEQAVLNIPEKRILSLNNVSDINWEKFPEYRGSHFIRDPRDLIVSGYYYHLWTQEQWCNKRNFNWTSIIDHPYYSQYIESNPAQYPSNISYQEYLNTLDKEKGMILEIIWRQNHFDQMLNWDFNNPWIIELKYEEIIGNEVDSFRKIFEHYNFYPKVLNRGLELAERFCLNKRQKSNTGHIRKGTTKQWEQEFSPLVRELFKEAYGNLLINAGYNW